MSESPSRIAAAALRRFRAGIQVPCDMPHLDALAALNERSVCRRYRIDPVPEEVVRLLCATALSAPTKSDLQQASLVRVADAAKRVAICALLPGSPWLADAPELFIFCADGWRLRQALRHVESTFAAAGTPVICAAQEDAAALISLQVERLRRLQRGVG